MTINQDVAKRLCADAASLMLELSIYAGSDSREDDHTIRELKVATAALMSACDATMMRSPPLPLPTPPPPPMPPQPLSSGPIRTAPQSEPALPEGSA
jgi:hypothetical protein